MNTLLTLMMYLAFFLFTIGIIILVKDDKAVRTKVILATIGGAYLLIAVVIGIVMYQFKDCC